MKTINKEMIIARIETHVWADVHSDGLSVVIHGHPGFDGNEQTARNVEALVKAERITEDRYGYLLLNIDYAPMKIAAFQKFIADWQADKCRDLETHSRIVRNVGVVRCDVFGSDNKASQNDYVKDSPHMYPQWAPDVNPAIYTQSAIDAEYKIQSAEQTIAKLEYAANVAARKDYYKKLAGIQLTEDIPEFIL